jgi:sucrose-phosphate synthase
LFIVLEDKGSPGYFPQFCIRLETQERKVMKEKEDGPSLYILMISVHGLIRSTNLELGKDSDTGGQTKYVVELATALGQNPALERVDLVTQLVDDPSVDDSYQRAEEKLGPKARIVRTDCGQQGYLRKEELWDYLDVFADNTVEWIRRSGRTPDLIHSHYADAGYVGCRLASLLGTPLVHTGHSLGRVKRRRLLAAGLKSDRIEKEFNLSRRIEAEERILATTDRVIASTNQEIEEQYELYDLYQPEKMRVIPPGVDLNQFQPPDNTEWDSAMANEISRFLKNPRKPIILALSRPDSRKNIRTLLSAYGRSEELQESANLIVIAGTREDITDLQNEPREIWTDLLLSIDRHNLYGKVAYPKQHDSEDVPILYRLAAASGGVFINPALTEPFGLTLLEASASGLPFVATEDGGPRDIVSNCKNGLLVNPLDEKSIQNSLLKILKNREMWKEFSQNGLKNVAEQYSWKAHVQSYLEMVVPIVEGTDILPRKPVESRPLSHNDRAIFSDLDQNLLGDTAAFKRFSAVLRKHRKSTAFGIITGRRLDSALYSIKVQGIPEPDVLMTSGGTEIYYSPELTLDRNWSNHIDHRWTPGEVKRILSALPGLKMQPKSEQSRFKISYYIDPQKAPDLEEINSLLLQDEQAVNAILSQGQFLDILPIRASKGLALRYFANIWEIPLQKILAVGGSGADEGMLRGNTLGVVVANRHQEELSQLVNIEAIYFSKKSFSDGILEAIEYYDFFNKCRSPKAETVGNPQ